MLDSVYNSSYKVSVIAIDNASTDDSISILQSYPQVQLIKSDLNLGFGKANNIGIKLALSQNAAAVFLLNQDTWIFEDTIGNLVNHFNENQNFGIVSPMHYSTNEIDLDTNFDTYLNRKKTKPVNLSLIEVPFVNAAAWLVSKQCFEKVGLFEPFFNHYGEDRNFCDRVHFHDFKIGIVTNSKIVHDRIVTRNFTKDILQSQYKIWNELININNSLLKSFFIGFKNIFGLPKFFYSTYGILKSMQLLYNLLLFYFKSIFNLKAVNSIRNSSKQAKNGW